MPPQYSCLENPMDRGAGRATVCGVSESDTIDQLHISTVSGMFPWGVFTLFLSICKGTRPRASMRSPCSPTSPDPPGVSDAPSPLWPQQRPCGCRACVSGPAGGPVSG